MSLLGRCLRFIYPPVSPQQSYEWGILQTRTLKNREVKSQDKRCIATEYWGWDSNPSLTPALYLLLHLSAHRLSGNGAAQQESTCVRACDMGQVREGGGAIWLVLPHFTNAFFPDRSSAHLLWLIFQILYFKYKESWKFRGLLYWFETSRHWSVLNLVVYLFAHIVPHTGAMEVNGDVIELITYWHNECTFPTHDKLHERKFYNAKGIDEGLAWSNWGSRDSMQRSKGRREVNQVRKEGINITEKEQLVQRPWGRRENRRFKELKGSHCV